PPVRLAAGEGPEHPPSVDRHARAAGHKASSRRDLRRQVARMGGARRGRHRARCPRQATKPRGRAVAPTAPRGANLKPMAKKFEPGARDPHRRPKPPTSWQAEPCGIYVGRSAKTVMKNGRGVPEEVI